MTSYIPGRLPATADPRVVKTPKCKSHVQGNCPASSLTHKHHRPHIAQQEPPQSRISTIFLLQKLHEATGEFGMGWIFTLQELTQ